MDRTKISTACIIGVTTIIAALFLCKGLTNFRKAESNIFVTGLAEKEIVSDLIVWNVTLNAEGPTRAEAYKNYENTRKIYLSYLNSKGIKRDEISEEGASLNKKTKSYYQNNNYVTVDDGYEVSQSIKVSSINLTIVEKAYQDVSNLFAQGIAFSSDAPMYYYTRLADLKKDLLHEASKNAYERAMTIADGCDCKVGKLTSSNMGVFQIVGKNSDEEYRYSLTDTSM